MILGKFGLTSIDHMRFSNANAAEASTSLAQGSLDHQGFHMKDSSHFGTDSSSHGFPVHPIGQSVHPISNSTNQAALIEHFLRLEKLEEHQPVNFIKLGAFNCPLSSPYPQLPQCFLRSAFKYAPTHTSWPAFLSARHKADLAQARYSAAEILDLSNNWAVLCPRCLQWGHHKNSCHAQLICINCSSPGHKADDCPLVPKSRTSPVLHDQFDNDRSGQNTNHSGCLPISFDMPNMGSKRATVRGSACGYYGHVERSCLKLRYNKKWQ